MIPTEEYAKKRILAVDDAAIILSRISDTLGRYYDVITVNSGVRALRYLEKEKPDLILLDIRMTPKDGLETLRDIRAMENRSDVPVIMLTGMEDKNPGLETSKLGTCDYNLNLFLACHLFTSNPPDLEAGAAGQDRGLP